METKNIPTSFSLVDLPMRNWDPVRFVHTGKKAMISYEEGGLSFFTRLSGAPVAEFFFSRNPFCKRRRDLATCNNKVSLSSLDTKGL